VRWGVLILLAAAAARANDNDVQLTKLGHPDNLGCTRCDGSAGDPSEPGDASAQARFHRYASTLGLAFAPPFQETAGTLGQAGFEVGFSSTQALLRKDSASSWAGESAAQPGTLVMPALVLRKGLGGSFELEVSAAWLTGSQMFAVSGGLKWALIDGLHYVPDLALRVWGTRVLGDRELDLLTLGADAMLSKNIAVAGTFQLQPYVFGGIAMVNAQTGPIDFKTTVENDANPSADDDSFHDVKFWQNRYVRGAAGLRAVYANVVLGLEGTFAQGTNPIAHQSPAPGETVQLWTVSARLGARF
jgi:hypothetical protein